MDSERLAGLTAELKGQLWLIEKVNVRLQSRLNAGLDTPGQLDSVAYQIHNLYCSIEDLLKLVAKAFENNVGTGENWHKVLLLRLSQPIEGIRPALLSEASWDVLDQLRGFRHLVRHAYGKDIELTQLQVNITAAQKLYQLIEQDIHTFVAELEKTVPT
ncbi:hypothetical protein S7335_1574 [Synechococcus sp. PCC 7335]|uniref:ribonuclease toxin HepT-like protein n=1 Tax=Synechococcus sp. (strain ATCC 29403 / PCC 7335) TaxID=91464 RepID=UPI00017ECE3D|nr:hypothetical protein [Synechococcus sp. PCC 7335]EDX83877.1 hypothetical protein S7335_1574 [Synechococcus sp. PCC 7335]